ncbi:DUF5615 family PIN-like protein [Nostoc sp.]
MMIWVDANLSPMIATWITSTFGITALSLRDVGLRDAEDLEIFKADQQLQNLIDAFGRMQGAIPEVAIV